MYNMTHSHEVHESIICVLWSIHICAMIHSYVCHDSFICVPWFIHIYDIAQWCVWQDSFLCGLWLKCVTYLTHTCDKTHLYVCYDSFICVTYLIYVCDIHRSNATTVCDIHCYPLRMCVTYIVPIPRPRPEGRHIYIYIYIPHLCVWHTSFIYVCDIHRSNLCHDSFTCKTRHFHVRHDSFIGVPWLIYRCDMTHL